MEMIRLAAPIVEKFEADGYTMTLRQLYYQLVATGKLENVVENYDRLGDAVSDGRLTGLISWTAIEDRVRFLRGAETFPSPLEAIKGLRESYRIDYWKNQPNRVEVWIEKDALLGVIGDVCMDLGVNYFSCKGYGSQSELWRAGQRFARYIQGGQRPIVLHMGDHDPSGVHMTEDNAKRLSLFAGVPVQVIRIALNMDQVEKFKPPPNPVKPKDARTAGYVERFGIETCWELDALSPREMIRLIDQTVKAFRDPKKWDEAMERDAQDKADLDDILSDLGGPDNEKD